MARKIPLRALDDLDRALMENISLTRKQIEKVISNLIADSQEKPEEVSVAFSRESMEKAIKDDPIELSKIRREHGAPTTIQELFPASEVDHLLSKIPTLSGKTWLNPDWTALRVVNQQTRREEIETRKLRRFGHPLIVGKIRDLVKGEKENIWAVEVDGFLIIQAGMATVFMNHLLEIPTTTVEVWLYRLEDIQPPEVDRPQSLDLLLLNLREFTERYAYRIPPTLEPLAEEARKTDLPDFITFLSGAKTEEETEAERSAERLELKRNATWLETYLRFQNQGKDQEEAARLTGEHQDYQMALHLATTANNIRANKVGEGDRARARLNQVRKLSSERAGNVNLVPTSEDEVRLFWHRANRVNL